MSAELTQAAASPRVSLTELEQSDAFLARHIGPDAADQAEMLATLGFSTRFPVWTVIAAVSSATAVLMGLAVIFGGAINYFIQDFFLQLAAGLVFIAFGLWTLFGKEKKEEEIDPLAKRKRRPFLFIFSTFFLAELGDKTQLAAFALTAKYGTPFQVWLGATVGMASVNWLAAFAGKWVKKYVADKHIKWAGGAIFIIFGLLTLWSLM